ncbi:glycerophosphodiester phosphodiesterase domain-containing protein 5-like [Saccoglossus kowalevskii]
MSNHCCITCVTSSLGCRWNVAHRSTSHTTLMEWIFFIFLVLAFILDMTAMYVWIVAENNSQNFNWRMWNKTGSLIDAYISFLGVCIFVFIVASILTILAVCHFVIKQKLYIHWLNKILVLLCLSCGIVFIIVIDVYFSEAWTHASLSLSFLAPFYQIVAVILVTFLSWPASGALARLWGRGQEIGCIILTLLYWIGLIILYLLPLAIKNCPCILENDALPLKPHIYANRGAEETDPHGSVSSLSTAMIDIYSNQTIPTLTEVLYVINPYNMSILLDVKQPTAGHPYDNDWIYITLQAIYSTGVSENEVVYWDNDGDHVNIAIRRQSSYRITNEYVGYPFDSISVNWQHNISTNILSVNTNWILSLYWCAGAPSVTTNGCQRSTALEAPLWILSPSQYLTIWLIFDFVSLFWVIVIFIIQFR